MIHKITDNKSVRMYKVGDNYGLSFILYGRENVIGEIESVKDALKYYKKAMYNITTPEDISDQIQDYCRLVARETHIAECIMSSVDRVIKFAARIRKHLTKPYK